MKKIIATLLCCFAVQQVAAESRCKITPGSLFKQERIDCSYRSIQIPSSDITSRQIKWELPLGTPPAGGWPVALIYQGSFFEVEFSRKKNAPFGGYWEARTIKALLDAGYAVIAPRAPAELAWLTNSAGPATIYEITTDYTFLGNVFDAIEQGVFGPLNPDRKYATGISSGGYNTSRMAVTWPGEFRALVVHSGSYATCLGPVCVMPLCMPEDHPPTRFVHGFLDTIVPWWSMDLYYDRLLWEGVETDRVTEALGGHEWFPGSPTAVVSWFDAHP
ncbi:extracellular medium-chain-length polyhydroxyalkanoate depolymerase [Microbulbifer taiwanensis]|uniref:Plasmid partitioning protein n=1 Tax=Microbulbifer taiwanensis TaxID=986746 RepID=A0ABW1YIF8_9GAMM|nr:plasmid partitioning protein [Microbulbifer taiwanensis]